MAVSAIEQGDARAMTIAYRAESCESVEWLAIRRDDFLNSDCLSVKSPTLAAFSDASYCSALETLG